MKYLFKKWTLNLFLPDILFQGNMLPMPEPLSQHWIWYLVPIGPTSTCPQFQWSDTLFHILLLPTCLSVAYHWILPVVLSLPIGPCCYLISCPLFTMTAHLNNCTFPLLSKLIFPRPHFISFGNPVCSHCSSCPTPRFAPH